MMQKRSIKDARGDFPMMDRQVHGDKRLVYLDLSWIKECVFHHDQMKTNHLTDQYCTSLSILAILSPVFVVLLYLCFFVVSCLFYFYEFAQLLIVVYGKATTIPL